MVSVILLSVIKLKVMEPFQLIEQLDIVYLSVAHSQRQWINRLLMDLSVRKLCDPLFYK